MFMRKIRLLASWACLLLLISLASLLASCSPKTETQKNEIAAPQWQIINAQGEPTARHEASFVEHGGKFYLIGGRRINPIDVYDPVENKWVAHAKTPIELHHFQAVSYGDKIYLIGAMTGGWPDETPLTHVMAYIPKTDKFEMLHEIPENRRRGGAGAVVHNDKIYLVGGIVNGHQNGYVNWVDEYDPKTGAWRVLPDAPVKRDHFSLAVANDRLYVMGGRQTEHEIGNDFGPTLGQVDSFDLKNELWLDENIPDLPTRRAGNMIASWENYIIVGGGESESQVPAHNEVEALNLDTLQWHRWPNLKQGRHGSAFIIYDGFIYTASGCGQRGGEPELPSIERLALSSSLKNSHIKHAQRGVNQDIKGAKNGQGIKLWHKLTLDFKGPNTREDDDINPFTDYRLLVEFTHDEQQYLVRGFYAADGKAAETSAEAGQIWQVRFMPNAVGDWSYKAYFHQGKNIAISRDLTDGNSIALENASGKFTVIASDKAAPDFRANERGLLTADTGYYRFSNSSDYWMKGGTNSPENLLAYEEFDNTYRMQAQSRAGEAAVTGSIHSFAPHLKDWAAGDPIWGDNKGKSLIGAMNYLAQQGMNAAYFLTLNILGDGKDVWPYISPDDFQRFDVSKLEQWEVLFSHMQSKGILLHVVTQETENELMLDGGDTGFDRSLYYSELIARFGHHPALVWNLGEENGPVHWRPEGQNDVQRQSMAQYFESHDPYGHPVIIHTHSQAVDKDDILTPLLGLAALDGLSFQVEDRRSIFAQTAKWKALAHAANKGWVITMDEVGPWYHGAMPDVMREGHDSLRRHALWGHLMGGGAGVEWYFGARMPANDLTTESFRGYENLWQQTRHAVQFFEDNIAYWQMEPCQDIIDRAEAYCAMIQDEMFLIYFIEGGMGFVNLPEGEMFDVQWYDPVNGGALQQGSVKHVQGGHRIETGFPPVQDGRDWVFHLTKTPR